MNKLRKLLSILILAPLSVLGWYDDDEIAWGDDETIDAVTFEYVFLGREQYGYDNQGEWTVIRAETNAACIVSMKFDESFKGVLKLPSMLGGYPVKRLRLWRPEESEDDSDPRNYGRVKTVWVPAGYESFRSEGDEWDNRGSSFDFFPKLTAITVDPGDTQYKSIDGVLYWYDDYYYGYYGYYGGHAGLYLSLAAYPRDKRDSVLVVPENTEFFDGYLPVYSDCCADFDDDDEHDDDEYKIPLGNPYLKAIRLPERLRYYYDGINRDFFPNATTVYCPMSFLKSVGAYFYWGDAIENLVVTGNGKVDGFRVIGVGSGILDAARNLSFEGNIMEIGKHAFANLLTIESVTLPEGLTTIGAGAFLNCVNLKRMEIPSSVKHIGKFAFAGCPAVESTTEDFAAALSLSPKGLAFTSEGAKPWGVDFRTVFTAPYGDGEGGFFDCEFKDSTLNNVHLRSGAIGHGEQSTLGLRLTAAGTFSFWWKTSSEANYDVLTFAVNGVERARRSGVGDWTRVETTVRAGDLVTWTYQKDGSVSDGEDAAYLKLVQLPDAPIETDVQDAFARLENENRYDKAEIDRLAARLDREVAARPSDYKLRVYRALLTLARTAEKPEARELFATCGYTLNWSDLFDLDALKASGVLSLKGLPTCDAAVDRAAAILVPALQAAQKDLNVIPESWSGTFLLDANVIPALSESVRIDTGDVLLLKAAAEGALGGVAYAQAQRLNANRDRLPLVFAKRATENFEEGCVTYSPSLVRWADDDATEPDVNDLLADHPDVLSGVRDAQKLATARQHVREALRLVLAADKAIAARQDTSLHFFEYDPKDEEAIAEARDNVTKANASLDRAQTFEFGPTKKTERLTVFAGALFNSRTAFTRRLFPKVSAANKAVLKSLPDVTLGGLLPSTTLDDWTRWASEDANVKAHVDFTSAGGISGGQTSGELDLSSSAIYNGMLIAAGDTVVGTIQVKAAKQKKDRKTGKMTSSVTVTVSAAGTTKKTTLKGVLDVADGTLTVTAKDGRVLELELGSNSLSGSFGDWELDGARDVFSSKSADDKNAAKDILAKWKGAVTVAWGDESGWNGLSVSVGSKGKTKVYGTLADGTRVSATSQLIVGEDGCCIPVVIAKRNVNLAFALWLSSDGEGIDASGCNYFDENGYETVFGRPATLDEDVAFTLDADALAELVGDDTYADYFPDGVSVAQKGSKWVVAGGAKAGKVTLGKDGEVDETKAGENPSALKLSYKAKDGTFSGTFKAYVTARGKPKAVTVNVRGVLVRGIGYGTATVKKAGSIPVMIGR